MHKVRGLARGQVHRVRVDVEAQFLPEEAAQKSGCRR